jgi:hypothetical protein
MLKKLFPNDENFIEVFINSIIGIGDILVFELKRGNTKKVKDNLEKLVDLFLSLFSPENLEKAKKILSILSTCAFKEQAIFSPENYAPGFIAIPEQIIRIYNEAMKNNNPDIASTSIYKLNKILSKLTTSQNNILYTEIILRKIAKIVLPLIEDNNSALFRDILSIYNQAVFSEEFELKYLERLELFLFELAKKVISDDKRMLF